MSDRQALFAGDILATGYWAADISEIGEDDTVLIIGAGPTGICPLQCVLLKHPRQVVVCEQDPLRLAFVQSNYPYVLAMTPQKAADFFAASPRGGADAVLEVAGGQDTFRMAWQLARPNAVVTVVALYDQS